MDRLTYEVRQESPLTMFSVADDIVVVVVVVVVVWRESRVHVEKTLDRWRPGGGRHSPLNWIGGCRWGGGGVKT